MGAIGIYDIICMITQIFHLLKSGRIVPDGEDSGRDIEKSLHIG